MHYLILNYKLILVGLFSIYILLCIFPGLPFSAINVGLDPSWVWGANYLAQSDYNFGLTFGPLGYLLVTLVMGTNLVQSTIFWYSIYGLFAILLILLVIKYKNLMSLALFCVTFLLFWSLM